MPANLMSRIVRTFYTLIYHIETVVPFSVVYFVAGVKTEEIRKGRILLGVQDNLEGILGDPSLTKILEKKHRKT